MIGHKNIVGIMFSNCSVINDKLGYPDHDLWGCLHGSSRHHGGVLLPILRETADIFPLIRLTIDFTATVTDHWLSSISLHKAKRRS